MTLRIFDTKGRLVRTLVDGPKSGSVETVWDLKDGDGRLVPSGVYFYRLEGSRFIETRRLTVLR